MSEKEGSLMWNGPAFTGSKIALIVGGGLITYKRDQKPDIPFPGMWDLPGGGREGDESPAECAIRRSARNSESPLLPP
ncbi:hypothetical protein CN172_30815 [Sinorhizobium meliloti]|uniref:NUDIX domain-containing protein n=1 Tax=Rhizobium meliloti TaxID=382 RepID=UPI000FDC4619|nr:NUDIX domain-containing protein [Sinorhizobium meliloti]RVE89918.1 hypothetical protein CN232_32265 [Sinorhizobium meliloti]RVH36411.1 hypothetical protein CN208_32350 [Sinorhizobium meliloti]RVK05332.1 hypothetical protein CN172_30815 [Sinorhizobium meliloti]